MITKNEFGQKTVKELLRLAYQEYGIPENGGLKEKQVKIELTKNIYGYIPNFQARLDVVMTHDAHHLMTGTPFSMIGETQIAMWEIAAGCWRNWFALWINSTTIPIGFFFNLPKMFKAFVKGRRCKSLYDKRYTDEEFLNMKAVDLYADIGLDNPELDKKATFGDYLAFFIWVNICFLLTLLATLTAPFLILYNIYVFTMLISTRKTVQKEQ